MILVLNNNKIEQMKTVQKNVEGCKNDEYTVGYYNGLEYAISVLTGKEPCYEMYERSDKDVEKIIN